MRSPPTTFRRIRKTTVSPSPALANPATASRFPSTRLARPASALRGTTEHVWPRSPAPARGCGIGLEVTARLEGRDGCSRFACDIRGRRAKKRGVEVRCEGARGQMKPDDHGKYVLTGAEMEALFRRIQDSTRESRRMVESSRDLIRDSRQMLRRSKKGPKP